MGKLINIVLVVLIVAVVYKSYINPTESTEVKSSKKVVVAKASVANLKSEKESLELEEQRLLEAMGKTKTKPKVNKSKITKSFEVFKPKKVKALKSDFTNKNKEKTQEELKKEEELLLASLSPALLKKDKKREVKAIKPYIEKQVVPAKKEVKEFEDLDELIEVKSLNAEKREQVKKEIKFSKIQKREVIQPKKFIKKVSKKTKPFINDFPDPAFDFNKIEGNLVSLASDIKEGVRIIKDTAIRVGPGFNYPRINVLTEGDRVRIIKHYENWSKIIDNNGIVSWVNNLDLE